MTCPIPQWLEKNLDWATTCYPGSSAYGEPFQPLIRWANLIQSNKSPLIITYIVWVLFPRRTLTNTPSKSCWFRFFLLSLQHPFLKDVRQDPFDLSDKKDQIIVTFVFATLRIEYPQSSENILKPVPRQKGRGRFRISPIFLREENLVSLIWTREGVMSQQPWMKPLS